MTYPSLEELVTILPIIVYDEPVLAKMTIRECKNSKSYDKLTNNEKAKIDAIVIQHPKKVDTIIKIKVGVKKVNINHAKALKKMNKTSQLYYCQKCFEPNTGDWWYFQHLLNTLIPKNKQLFINQNCIGDVYLQNKNQICISEMEAINL